MSGAHPNEYAKYWPGISATFGRFLSRILPRSRSILGKSLNSKRNKGKSTTGLLGFIFARAFVFHKAQFGPEHVGA
jgi:hypothetical protein